MGEAVSVWSGEMRLLGVTLHLHVLEDGTRIIEAESMTALLEAMERGVHADKDEVAAFARWQRGALTPDERARFRRSLRGQPAEEEGER